MRLLLLFGLGLLVLGACATAPSTAEDRKVLDTQCEAAVSAIKRKDPGIERFFTDSVAYAIFPSIGKGGIGVAGAYGRGQLYEDGRMVGFCDLSQASVGLQLGGQSYTEIIFFQTEAALQNFKANNFEFAAGASAVAAESGAATTADYSNGVAVFTMVKGGLMYEASIGGQSFSYQPK